MQHLEVSGAVRHIYVIRRLKVNAVMSARYPCATARIPTG